MDTQDKNILKTVLIIVIAILTILALFFNKITTPRFLSSIELKVNGYILLDTQNNDSRKNGTNIFNAKPTQWTIVILNENQRQATTNLLDSLKSPIKNNTKIRLLDKKISPQLLSQLPEQDDIIPVIDNKNRLNGYFKAPFDRHKMVITYSSVYTHR